MVVTIKPQLMKDGTTKLKAESPYHPDFPVGARKLGGKWNPTSKAWYFDLRDEERVRTLCTAVYGTDGTVADAEDLVTVRPTLGGTYWSFDHELWAFGRRLAVRRERDYAVSLGDGVIVVEGDFMESGGSRKNPRITLATATVVLEIRDVPALLVEKDRARFGDALIITGDIPATFRQALSGE